MLPNMEKTEKIFVADDKYEDVIQELKNRGWSHFPHISFPKYQFKWVNYSKIQWSNIRKDQIINHLKNSIVFSHKANFAAALKETYSVRELNSFFPRTFDFTKQEEIVQFSRFFVYSQAIAILKRWVNKSDPLPSSSKLKSAMTLVEQVLQDSKDIGNLESLDVTNSKWIGIFKANNDSTISVHEQSLLNERIDELLNQLEESDFQSNFVSADNVWILKPSNLSQGRGIRVFHSLKDLFEEVQKRAKEPFVVQKYLERPMLIFGRKFDIRQWVLISSANPDPLRVHWYPKCYIRFCSKKFKTDDLSDKFIHLCNNSIQRFNYLEQEGTFIEGLMWTSNEFQHYLVTSFTDPNIWSETILPQMKNAALQSIKAVKNRLIRVGKGFEWLGFDFMIDEALRVWLIEINVSPDVSHGTKVTSELVPVATKDTLNVILDSSSAGSKDLDGWLPLLSESPITTDILPGNGAHQNTSIHDENHESNCTVNESSSVFNIFRYFW